MGVGRRRARAREIHCPPISVDDVCGGAVLHWVRAGVCGGVGAATSDAIMDGAPETMPPLAVDTTEIKEQLIKAAAKIVLAVIVVILMTAWISWRARRRSPRN